MTKKITEPNWNPRVIDTRFDAELAQFFEGVDGVVEANSYEKMKLWEEYKNDGKVWKENSSGLWRNIGNVAGNAECPVCISMFYAIIDNHKILFIDPTSNVVDHTMIEKWLIERLPDSAKNNHGAFINKTNAMNFYNVFREKKVEKNAEPLALLGLRELVQQGVKLPVINKDEAIAILEYIDSLKKKDKNDA